MSRCPERIASAARWSTSTPAGPSREAIGIAQHEHIVAAHLPPKLAFDLLATASSGAPLPPGCSARCASTASAWWRWRGRLFAPRYGYAPGWSGFGWRQDPFFDRRYDRAVALLMRDRATGEALFEAHASNEGLTMGSEAVIANLFDASLAEFPKVNPKSHRVSVQALR